MKNLNELFDILITITKISMFTTYLTDLRSASTSLTRKGSNKSGSLKSPLRFTFLYGMLLTVIYQNIVIEVKANPNDHQINDEKSPQFSGQIISDPLTPRIGNDVTLACPIKHLGKHKISWNFVDKQTLLVVQNYVISDDPRIDIKKESDGEVSKWNLIIRNVSLSDSGYYICQINTSPPKRLLKFLSIFVPPEFDNYESFESDSVLIVKEYENVTLTCKAKGNPKPTISWRKQDGPILLKSHSTHKENKEVVYSEVLNLGEVSRLASGSYMCIATNDVSPSIRRRLSLEVHFPPTIMVPTQVVSAFIGHNVTLECITESNPLAQHIWFDVMGNRINSDKLDKYVVKTIRTNAFKVFFKLTINNLDLNDSGKYVCLSNNQLGVTRSWLTLNVYESTISSALPPFSSEEIKIKLNNYSVNWSPFEKQIVSINSPESHLDRSKNNCQLSCNNYNFINVLHLLLFQIFFNQI